MYVLDTNVFITAARSYYSFDFAQKFWDFLVEQAKKDIVGSVDKVFEELKKGDDELSRWAKSEYLRFFYSTKTNNVLSAYQKVMNAVASSGQYNPKALEEFAKEDNADAWIIAFALAGGHTVITHERIDNQSKRKIFIPNVCMLFDVKFMDTFQLLKDLKFHF